MKQVIVTDGDLFDKLETWYEYHKYPIVRIPIYQPPMVDFLAGEAYPIRPLIEYEEWERMFYSDANKSDDISF